MNKTLIVAKTTALLLSFIVIFSSISADVQATGILEEFLGISFYHFHYLDENGKEQENSFHNWGSKDEEKNGIKIVKESNKIKVVIDADSNELYMKCKPAMLWMHKADSFSDITKWTDIDKWYTNKLEETFLLCAIEDYTQDCEIVIDVPVRFQLSVNGILNGGYYELEFYSEDCIPEKLKYAYAPQTYSIEELEEYMKVEMNENVADYYNADSGFRSDVDGFAFRNTDYVDAGGCCSGIAAITTAKYNGFNLVKDFKQDSKEYSASNVYTWYPYIYDDAPIHQLQLDDKEFLIKTSPSLNMQENGIAKAYPLAYFSDSSEGDETFYQLLNYYQLINNIAVLTKGNFRFKEIKISHLENRWSIIDYVASYLRQGKAVSVNISKPNSGHTIVGYKMEQIDEDTFRLYCYDSNFPDDMQLQYIEGKERNMDIDEDGAYKNVAWGKRDVYIDFTKKTIVGKHSLLTQKEYEVFEFDSSHTSFNTNSSEGTITFTICEGEEFRVFNYGSKANENIAYRAFPVILSDKTVQIRTFAFYKNGEVVEVTNSINTTVKMNYNFIGWYKIKDSKITLTKDNYKFDNNGEKYIECVVTYDNHTDSFGSVQVRIPIS